MTRELKGILIILAAYLAGELCSRLIGGFMPGNVLGMLLLFTLLQCGVVKEEDIKGVCNFILSHMMLFFVPIVAGIIVGYKFIVGEWVAVVTMLILSTILILIVVGYLQQYFGKRWRR